MLSLGSMISVIVTFTAFLAGSEAVTVEVIKPIKSTGVQVGLIFIPGFFFDGEQYRETAQAIQEASSLQIWVALTGDYKTDAPNQGKVQNALEMAIAELKSAGMNSTNFVGVSHGASGDFLQKFAKASKLGAIIMMGSVLPETVQLREYPIPVLTLAAEMDGLTPINNVAEAYEQMAIGEDVWAFFIGLYATPVIYIEGANHGQFASGEMPDYVKDADLVPEKSDSEVHDEIGKHVNDFLVPTFSDDLFRRGEALAELTEAFVASVEKFQPILDMRDLETDGLESMWAVLAQEHFAGDYSGEIFVYNEVLQNPSFFAKQPSIEIVDGSVVVGTAALIHTQHKGNTIQLRPTKESAAEINMKLVSREAIRKALNETNLSLKSKPRTCESLNQLALATALSVSTRNIRELYFTRGRAMYFEKDINTGSNFMWALTPLVMREDEDGLHVRSVSMVTSVNSFMNPGVHYCKVMSPHRAMEWVNVDAFRPYNK